MDAVTNLLGGFVDKFEPAIRQHVERNVEETKGVLIQSLPPALQDVLNPGGSMSGERSLDRSLVDAIKNKVQNKFGNVLENIQEKLRVISQEQVNRASTGTVEFLTQAIVKESKDCVTNKVGGFLAHQKKKGEEGSRGISLDFINQGRQAAISRSMEQIEPKVHQSGLEIYNKLVSGMPEAVQQLLNPGGSGEATRGILDDGLRKVLDRVREVVQQVVGNIMPTFEKSILQNIQRELESKVPDQNLVLSFVQKFASKIELGKFGNLGTLLGSVLGAGAAGGAVAATQHSSGGTSGGLQDNYGSSQGQSNYGSSGLNNNSPGYSSSTSTQNYGQPLGQGNHDQPQHSRNYPSVPSEGNYSQPSNQGNYSQPSSQGNYNQPSSQGNYDQPPSQSNYNQSSNQSSYNQPPSQSNYNQSSNQSSYNQPQSQGNYNQPPSQSNYSQPPSQGNYYQQPSQAGYNQPSNQSSMDYSQTGGYNPSREFQPDSREMRDTAVNSPPFQSSYQPGGFGIPRIPTPEDYQQPQRPGGQDDLFPGGFYLPKQ
ncbi:hypothetical protein K7432_009207 [Basidiobolus ranarum]|uniref:Uncharacterized protein n=1 Tax=Basidiobolus ranarum TaxID=34480 RepID=A0ABR2VXF3_9FUNG